jgi:hypothetical protein
MLTGGTQKVICSGDDRSCTANESKQTIETLSKIAIQFSYSRDDITALPPSTPSHYIEKSCEEGLRCPTVARGAWMRRLIPGEERHQGRRDEQCQAAYHLHGPIYSQRKKGGELQSVHEFNHGVRQWSVVVVLQDCWG